jgi:phosphohistidine phosphatase
MIIYFLRHASAGESLVNPKKDEKRALDNDGIEQCGYVGRALAAIEVQVDVIISSPLKRATQTASLVGNEMGYEGKLQIENALRPGATFSDFRRMLEK